jgi:hypothetical protein
MLVMAARRKETPYISSAPAERTAQIVAEDSAAARESPLGGCCGSGCRCWGRWLIDRFPAAAYSRR